MFYKKIVIEAQTSIIIKINMLSLKEVGFFEMH